jgi:tetratricopeptide (TPR) repeat protein
MSLNKRQNDSTNRRKWLIAAGLAALTFIVFAPALDCKFVNLDDPDYVTNNTRVKSGLTLDGARWALATFSYGNWHPLTWLSLQLDATLWQLPEEEGPDPRGFHLTNVLVHSASAGLLFLTLEALTGALWPSLIVAALFAVHPLRVESVAWVAERKDVLSTFFGILALLAYAGYVRQRTLLRYLAVCGAFVVSLMCKPMMVTLPCLLLVLDWWPLSRVRTWRDYGRLFLEKCPLFAVVALSSFVTFIAQSRGGAVMPLETFPMSARFENAAISYAEYLKETFWPVGLAVFYPHRYYPWGAGLALPTVIGATVLLVAITGIAIYLWRKAPYFLAGWLWYIGTLVPVIGIIQAGDQSHADRYTYFPQIGILIAVCWSVAALAQRWPTYSLAASAVVVLCLCVLTREQITHWQDSEKLWRHDLATVGNNPLALTDLGVELDAQGRPKEADDSLRASLALSSNSALTHINRGNLLLTLNRLPEAEIEFSKACELAPYFPHPRTQLSEVLLRQNKLEKAEEENAKALVLAPDLSATWCNMGFIETAKKNYEKAAENFEESIRLDPKYSAAHTGLGMLLFSHLGKKQEGLEHLEKAVVCNKRSGEGHFFLALAYESLGDRDKATDHLESAARFSPGLSQIWAKLATQYYLQRRFTDAANCFQRAAEVEPNIATRQKYLDQARRLEGNPLNSLRPG